MFKLEKYLRIILFSCVLSYGVPAYAMDDITAINSGDNVIGKVGDNGNINSYVDENGNVMDESGNIIGRADEKGKVVSEDDMVITHHYSNDGTCAPISTKLVEGMDGSIIGYIDIKSHSSIHGRIDENMNFIDANGNIIGKVGKEWRDMVLDENRKIIGYIDENGKIISTNGNFLAFSTNEDVHVIIRDCSDLTISFISSDRHEQKDKEK